MKFEDSLLFQSLILLSDITAEKEAEYWSKGINTLSDLADSVEEQLSFFSESITDEVNTLVNRGLGNINDIICRLENKTGKKDFYRVAYSIPEYVMFIDIETTGLSPVYHYVTVIGWMMNGQYKYWNPGMDTFEFINDFKKCKLIVTFNGTRFDRIFIDKLFPELNALNKPNLDLLYFCHRFNLSNGQKYIEDLLGFKRPADIKECDGKEAIALWYKFIFGEDDALKTLINYNYLDVIGMTFILDKIFFGRVYGNILPKLNRPEKFYHGIKKIKVKYCKKDYVRIRMLINNRMFDISRLNKSNDIKILGIDLAGVIKKTSKTGICILKGDNAKTEVLTTDEEIIDFVKNTQPELISIDAPLSLPHGRTTVYDDDPMRMKVGIMRYCEKELHRRNVNSYPALISSMQKLTKRGIKLSSIFRKMGYPVIECFPGAAQDILQLPRKRTDQTLLKTGLMRLGIKGEFETKKVYHDELDAITAAIVGKFFIDEYYEAIGIPEENDMIVPDTSKRESNTEIIIGLTGHIAAGKTTAARYLEKAGFSYCRYSEIIAKLLQEDNIEITRDTLQEKGNEIFNSNSQYKLNELLYKEINRNRFIVIDGMRHYEDYTFWKEKNFLNFHLVYINTDESIRIKRYAGYSYIEKDQNSVEKDIDDLKLCADFIIDNNSDYIHLRNQLEYIVNCLKISK